MLSEKCPITFSDFIKQEKQRGHFEFHDLNIETSISLKALDKESDMKR